MERNEILFYSTTSRLEYIYIWKIAHDFAYTVRFLFLLLVGARKPPPISATVYVLANFINIVPLIIIINKYIRTIYYCIMMYVKLIIS
jgi:hypothetical protein